MHRGSGSAESETLHARKAEEQSADGGPRATTREERHASDVLGERRCMGLLRGARRNPHGVVDQTGALGNVGGVRLAGLRERAYDERKEDAQHKRHRPCGAEVEYKR